MSSYALPHPVRPGLSERAERIFEQISFSFVILLALAWAYAIGTARAHELAHPRTEAQAAGDKVNHLTPATASMVNAVSSSNAPTTAYVTDAIAKAVYNLPPSVTGESGKLRARIDVGDQPGIVKAAIAVNGALKPFFKDFSLITMRPASQRQNGRIGLYYIGTWPAARKTKGGLVDYSPPSGFIEVTKANENTQLSEHFKLRDFLTHDQQSVWPKYLVINLKLIDKLELVLDDLRQHGINPDGVHVMSGFRTPQYNVSGGDPSGRASLSRHMYGDAADIYIDNNGDGQMDDLNHDGKIDINDARVIAAAVDRVERAHPSLVGGCGVYSGTSAHGPFIHIDTRGYPARWTGTGD